MLDLEGLVAVHDPNAPKPWVVEPLIIAGMLAIVAGKGGTGKTWVIHEAADAVSRGTTKAGMKGHGPLPVLIIDAEMGAWLTTDRFKTQGYNTDPAYMHVFDAQGMDLRIAENRQLVWEAAMEILGPRGGLLVIDSLRAIVPSAKENESDDMGPVVTWIRKLCRETNAAGILVHHAGWREERTRGSSAIKDQADTVWYLGKDADGDVLRLTCAGADLKAPRWGPPPRDLYLRIAENGGLVLADAPRERTEELREQVLKAIHEADPPMTTKTQIARAVGKADPKTIDKALADLIREGEVVKPAGSTVYQAVETMTAEAPAV
jgi:hypothetical protein